MRFVAGLLTVLFVSTPAFAESYPVITQKNPFASPFYVPNDSNQHPSVIMLHGSEGGSEPFIDAEANILATQGYSVMTYCYFDCGRGLTGPRQTLKDVEATRVLDVVSWLRSRPQSNGWVAVYGFSRGAELTMIVGSLGNTKANKPNVLVAHSPSDVFNGPWNWSWREPSCWLCRNGIGQCPEGSPYTDYQWNPSCGPDNPSSMDLSKSAWKVGGTEVPAHKRIEVEKFDNPILITVGEKDEVWPVDQTRRIEAILKAAKRNPEVHYFPDQGHIFWGSAEVSRREAVVNFFKANGSLPQPNAK
jgi:dienelactone hydrolase